ncbi:MFS transporter [Enterococcus pallens]
MRYTDLSNSRKYAMIALLAFFGGCIYKVTYLREVFYDQVISVLNLSNAQLGLLSSAVGFTSMIGYFFGGFLADRLSSRKLVTTSCMISGLLTLWYMTYPSFIFLMIIHIAIALAGTLIFWAAYIRIIRILGGEDGQGKYFGFSEGMRSLFGVILPFGALAIMENIAQNVIGYRSVLLYYAICYFVSGILAFFVIVDVHDESEERVTLNKEEYVKLFKTPGLWLVAILIFGTYAVFALQSYTTPYMSGVVGISSSTVGSVAIFRQYGLGLLAMPVCGVIADKMHSSARTCIIGLVLLLISSVMLMVYPATSSPIVIIMLVMAIGFFVSGVRGVYYATMDEAKISKALSGTAIGIVSAIGFSPDAFMFSQVGGWLDKYPPEQAYKMIFTYMAAMSGIAICAGIGILVLSRKKSVATEGL